LVDVFYIEVENVFVDCLSLFLCHFVNANRNHDHANWESIKKSYQEYIKFIFKPYLKNV
jgi:hypothetical protein